MTLLTALLILVINLIVWLLIFWGFGKARLSFNSQVFKFDLRGGEQTMLTVFLVLICLITTGLYMVFK